MQASTLGTGQVQHARAAGMLLAFPSWMARMFWAQMAFAVVVTALAAWENVQRTLAVWGWVEGEQPEPLDCHVDDGRAGMSAQLQGMTRLKQWALAVAMT